MGYRAKIGSLLVALMLSACSTVEYVKVPPVEPPVIARPDLEIDALKPGDSPSVVIQAHRLAIIKLKRYAEELEAALGAYRTK